MFTCAMARVNVGEARERPVEAASDGRPCRMWQRKPKALAALFPAQPTSLGTTGGAAVRSKAAENR